MRCHDCHHSIWDHEILEDSGDTTTHGACKIDGCACESCNINCPPDPASVSADEDYA